MSVCLKGGTGLPKSHSIVSRALVNIVLICVAVKNMIFEVFCYILPQLLSASFPSCISFVDSAQEKLGYIGIQAVMTKYLKPNLYLSLCEIEHVGHLNPPRAAKIPADNFHVKEI